MAVSMTPNQQKLFLNGSQIFSNTPTTYYKFSDLVADTFVWGISLPALKSFQGTAIFAAIAASELPKSDIIKISENLIRGNQDGIDTANKEQNWQFIFQCQEGSFYEGTSEPMCRNLARYSDPNQAALDSRDVGEFIDKWDATCNGWSGASVADRLADLRSNIYAIKSSL